MLMDQERLAGLLGVSPATLEAWRCRGCGPVFVKVGKLVRYHPDDVRAFIQARRRGGPSRLQTNRADLKAKGMK